MVFDADTLILWGMVLFGVCAVGVVLLVVLQVLSGVLGVFGGLFEGVFSVLAGGPIAWCGCLLVVLLCAGCGVVGVFLSQLLSSCGTPNAINLCRLVGL